MTSYEYTNADTKRHYTLVPSKNRGLNFHSINTRYDFDHERPSPRVSSQPANSCVVDGQLRFYDTRLFNIL